MTHTFVSHSRVGVFDCDERKSTKTDGTLRSQAEGDKAHAREELSGTHLCALCGNVSFLDGVPAHLCQPVRAVGNRRKCACVRAGAVLVAVLDGWYMSTAACRRSSTTMACIWARAVGMCVDGCGDRALLQLYFLPPMCIRRVRARESSLC